jgi:hypothetical protein
MPGPVSRFDTAEVEGAGAVVVVGAASVVVGASVVGTGAAEVVCTGGAAAVAVGAALVVATGVGDDVVGRGRWLDDHEDLLYVMVRSENAFGVDAFADDDAAITGSARDATPTSATAPRRIGRALRGERIRTPSTLTRVTSERP